MNKKFGIIAGNFDVIHPGYVYMLNEAKLYCDHLTIALQTDPTIERPEKCKPILSFDERKDILLCLSPVDEVIKYTTEKDLEDILKVGQFDVRILGSDYIGKQVTGQDFSKEIIYVSRDHGWSTTKFKNMICKSLHGE